MNRASGSAGQSGSGVSSMDKIRDIIRQLTPVSDDQVLLGYIFWRTGGRVRSSHFRNGFGNYDVDVSQVAEYAISKYEKDTEDIFGKSGLRGREDNSEVSNILKELDGSLL
jgi:hypothetical protein